MASVPTISENKSKIIYEKLKKIEEIENETAEFRHQSILIELKTNKKLEELKKELCLKSQHFNCYLHDLQSLFEVERSNNHVKDLNDLVNMTSSSSKQLEIEKTELEIFERSNQDFQNTIQNVELNVNVFSVSVADSVQTGCRKDTHLELEILAKEFKNLLIDNSSELYDFRNKDHSEVCLKVMRQLECQGTNALAKIQISHLN